MDELLAGLHDEGRLDSSDCFTIDLERARSKLDQYQLPDPGLYLLKLVQAAVAGRSRGIRFRLAPGLVVARWDAGQELSGVLRRRDEPVLRYLSDCFLLSLGRQPRRLLLQGPGLKLEALDGQVTLQPAPAPECRFELHTDTPPWAGKSDQYDAEFRALKSRCRFCPIPVVVHGQLVNRPLAEELGGGRAGPDMLERVVLGPPREAGLAAPTLEMRRPSWFRPGNAPGGDPFPRRFWIPKPVWTGLVNWTGTSADAPYPEWELPDDYTGLRLRHLPYLPARAILNSSGSQLVFVRHGIQLEPKPLPREGLTVVMQDFGLRTDLSEFSVVEDSAYETAMAWALAQAAELENEAR